MANRILVSLVLSLMSAGCTLVPGKKAETGTGTTEPDPRDLKPAAAVFAFNLLAFGNVDLSESAIQGRLGVSNDAKLSSYAVGTLLKEDKTRCDVAVGGDLDFEQGSVYQGRICTKGKTHTADVGWKFPGSGDPGTDFTAL